MIAMVIATPLGLGAAMYLSEYASPKTRRRLKPILETLAGIPSVVLGYFALQVINPAIVQTLFATSSTFTIMAAGIGVGILTIPLVASVAEDAMYAVPGVAARGRLRHRGAPAHGDDEGRVPRRGLGHRGVADPRVLSGDRRDDGRGDRGRCDGLGHPPSRTPWSPARR